MPNNDKSYSKTLESFPITENILTDKLNILSTSIDKSLKSLNIAQVPSLRVDLGVDLRYFSLNTLSLYLKANNVKYSMSVSKPRGIV